jgi:hypothetical protein
MRTAKQIIEDITSRDTHKVWLSSCEIIKSGQNHSIITPLVEYLPEIKEKTKGLDMGGLVASNQRFVDFAIRTIEFHRDSKECPCILYKEHETFNPKEEAEKGNIKIIETIMIDENYPDYYLAECLRCGRKIKISEREYHYTWWQWELL